MPEVNNLDADQNVLHYVMFDTYMSLSNAN